MDPSTLIFILFINKRKLFKKSESKIGSKFHFYFNSIVIIEEEFEPRISLLKIPGCYGTIRIFYRINTGYASNGNMLWGGGPAYGVKSIRSKKKYLNINLMSNIPNPIN